MKTTIKRTTAMLLALVLCLTAFLGGSIPTAHAAEQRAEVRNIQFPREGDDNYDAAWGHPALKYRNGWETSKSGKNIIRAMESYGSWVIREIAAPEGYLLTEESYPVTVSEDGQVIVIEIVNEQITGSVKLTKVDRDYPENKLTGAEFQIWADSNGDELLTEDDILFGSMVETEPGIYELFDLPFGGYFVREIKAPDGFVLDENAYFFRISEDGQTVIVENEAGVGFLNAPKTGKLKIIKTSSNGKVAGFSFLVTGPNGYEQTFTTDETGVIKIDGLRIGKYTVSEVSDDASEGYVRPKPQTVEVIDSETITVEMYNHWRDTPKTGDDSTPNLWLALLAASAIGLTLCGVYFYRKRKH